MRRPDSSGSSCLRTDSTSGSSGMKLGYAVMGSNEPVAARDGVIKTVGHGTLALEDLAALLDSTGVTWIIDVRRFPESKRQPHFNRSALEQSCPRLGLGYEWRGEALGGRRRPLPESPNHAWRNASFRGFADHMRLPEFRHAIDQLHWDAEKRPTPALMCAETLWWRCHRRLIADALVVGGTKVEHVLPHGSPRAHSPHEALRIEENGLLVYDVGSTPELSL
jgi:uncharacterized protein (DUF488 family)